MSELPKALLLAARLDRSTSENSLFRDAADELRRLHSLAQDQAETIQFVERWAVHHGSKPSCTPKEALSCIQHYPAVCKITKSYADGKVPDTFDPYARIAELKAALNGLLRRVADDEEYGPEHAITIARAALAKT